MSDADKRNGVPEVPEPARPEAGPVAVHEEDVARLLRMAGPRPAVGSDRTERVRTAVHARWRAEVRARRHDRFVRWIVLPATAAAVGIAAIGLARWLPVHAPGDGPKPLAILERVRGPFRLGDGGSAAVGAPFRPGVEISTGPGGLAALKLSSGASLRLGSETTLRLVSATVLDLKRGAVYVDSGGVKEGAVTVRTPVGLIRDVGTQFEVLLREDSLRVTVREGVASLGRRNADLEIQAGTRLTAGPHGETSRTAVPPNSPDWDWVLEIAPPLHLEDQTLGVFLAWVSRETGWQVRFAGMEAGEDRASTVLHGSLEGVRPDEAPAAVLPTCGLKSHLEGNVLVVEPLDASKDSP